MQSIQFDLDRKNFLRASLIHIKPRSLNLFKCALLCITFLLILHLFFPDILIHGGSAVLILTLFLFGKYYIVNPYQEKKYFEESEQEGFHFQFEYDDELFTIETHTGSATLKWNEIWDWRTNRDYLLIYPSTIVYHVLPRTLESISEEVMKIENILRKNLGRPS